jgi:3-(methylthio)propionyl---CoA ligase
MPSYPQSPLTGQMMHHPLLISNILVHADRHFGESEIVSRRVEGMCIVTPIMRATSGRDN